MTDDRTPNGLEPDDRAREDAAREDATPGAFDAWASPADWPPQAEAPVEPPTGQPSWTPPAYGAPPYAPPAYGAPRSPYPPPPAQPGYAPQPGYGEPPGYGSQPGYREPPNGPGQGGWGPTFPGSGDYLESPPPRRHRRAIVVAAIVTVLVLAGAGVGVGLATSHNGKHQQADKPAASHSATPSPATPGHRTAPRPTPTSPGSGAPAPQNTPAGKPGPLDSYVVKPSAVAPGAVMLLGDGGRSVTDVATLDYCGLTYASDKLRQTRVQVAYGTRALIASNEFVKYKPGGGAQAFAELKKAFASCPSSFDYPDDGGSVTQVKPFSLSGVSGLETDSLASAQYVTTLDGGGQWNVAIYQFKGDYFSGVYTYGPDKASDESLAKKLAVDAAKHLGEAAAGKPGTGGGAFAGASQPGQPGSQT